MNTQLSQSTQFDKPILQQSSQTKTKHRRNRTHYDLKQMNPYKSDEYRHTATQSITDVQQFQFQNQTQPNSSTNNNITSTNDSYSNTNSYQLQNLANQNINNSNPGIVNNINKNEINSYDSTTTEQFQHPMQQLIIQNQNNDKIQPVQCVEKLEEDSLNIYQNSQFQFLKHNGEQQNNKKQYFNSINLQSIQENQEIYPEEQNSVLEKTFNQQSQQQLNSNRQKSNQSPLTQQQSKIPTPSNRLGYDEKNNGSSQEIITVINSARDNYSNNQQNNYEKMQNSVLNIDCSSPSYPSSKIKLNTDIIGSSQNQQEQIMQFLQQKQQDSEDSDNMFFLKKLKQKQDNVSTSNSISITSKKLTQNSQINNNINQTLLSNPNISPKQQKITQQNINFLKKHAYQQNSDGHIRKTSEGNLQNNLKSPYIRQFQQQNNLLFQKNEKIKPQTNNNNNNKNTTKHIKSSTTMIAPLQQSNLTNPNNTITTNPNSARSTQRSSQAQQNNKQTLNNNNINNQINNNNNNNNNNNTQGISQTNNIQINNNQSSIIQQFSNLQILSNQHSNQQNNNYPNSSKSQQGQNSNSNIIINNQPICSARQTVCKKCCNTLNIENLESKLEKMEKEIQSLKNKTQSLEEKNYYLTQQLSRVTEGQINQSQFNENTQKTMIVLQKKSNRNEENINQLYPFLKGLDFKQIQNLVEKIEQQQIQQQNQQYQQSQPSTFQQQNNQNLQQQQQHQLQSSLNIANNNIQKSQYTVKKEKSKAIKQAQGGSSKSQQLLPLSAKRSQDNWHPSQQQQQ